MIRSELLKMVRDDIVRARSEGVNFDPVDIEFECPTCGDWACVMVSQDERVVVTPLGEDHECFEPLRLDLDELFVSDNPIARAALDAISVYYSEREDEDTP